MDHSQYISPANRPPTPPQGIGGGTIVTPLMALTTGLAHQTVLGTSLAAMVVPSLVAMGQHARLGNIDWLMAGRAWEI